MRSVVYTVIFQITSIIIFGLLYWKFSEDFTSSTSKDTKYKIPFLDCFYTSVTIQASVGGPQILNPNTDKTKLLIMLQQFLMITSNVLILYLFSVHLLSSHGKYHK